MRPTLRRSLIPLIPDTIVKKMMKGIKTLITAIKPSPSGCILTAIAGEKCPSSTAATRAINTSSVRWRDNQLAKGRRGLLRIRLRYRNLCVVLVLVFILFFVFLLTAVPIAIVVVIIVFGIRGQPQAAKFTFYFDLRLAVVKRAGVIAVEL